MKKLYETNSQLKTCTATVTACYSFDGSYYINLDQSIFFPEGGGQCGDTGWISYGDSTVKVLDSQVGNAPKLKEFIASIGLTKEQCKKDEIIFYQTDTEIPVGTEVLCKLDWETRFMRMQQHSGEHIMSGLVHKLYGYDNTSFHLSDTEPIIMCFSGPLSEEDTAKLEAMVNEIIYEDIPIVDSYPSKEELSSITYRSKIEIEGQVRLISIEDVDVCACCAPHVMSTAKVGVFKIISQSSYKGGGTQLNVLCGKRAYDYIASEHKMLSDLAKSYSVAISEIPQTMNAQRDALLEATGKLAGFIEGELLNKVASLTESDTPCIFGADLSPHAMKITYNALTEKFNTFCGVFSGNDTDGYQFYAGNPKLDSRELAAKMREQLQSKGGGSAEMIQGKLGKTAEEISGFFSSL